MSRHLPIATSRSGGGRAISLRANEEIAGRHAPARSIALIIRLQMIVAPPLEVLVVIVVRHCTCHSLPATTTTTTTTTTTILLLLLHIYVQVRDSLQRCAHDDAPLFILRRSGFVYFCFFFFFFSFSARASFKRFRCRS